MPDEYDAALRKFPDQLFNGKLPYAAEHDPLFINAMLTALDQKLAPPRGVLQVMARA